MTDGKEGMTDGKEGMTDGKEIYFNNYII